MCEKKEYTESSASKYTSQLLSALNWLHSRNFAHLDVKPENILLDQETEVVKLVDLGEAVRGPVDEVVPPADLEFAAPELVLGRPTGNHTDMWAAGVFIYVLLRCEKIHFHILSLGFYFTHFKSFIITVAYHLSLTILSKKRQRIY